MLSAAIVLAGCNRPRSSEIDASDCWDATKLRVEVGNQLFDLPRNIELHNQKSNDYKKIKYIKQKYNNKSEFRLTCQSKADVPINIGAEASYVIYSDYGVLSPFKGELMSSYSDKFSEMKKRSIADEDHVRDIKYLGYRPEVFRDGKELVRRLEFSFNGKKASMLCQVWGSQKQGRKSWVDGSTFAHSCVGGVPITSKGLVITLRDPNMVRNSSGQGNVMQDPSIWPSRWVEVVAKINAARVNGKGE